MDGGTVADILLMDVLPLDGLRIRYGCLPDEDDENGLDDEDAEDARCGRAVDLEQPVDEQIVLRVEPLGEERRLAGELSYEWEVVTPGTIDLDYVGQRVGDPTGNRVEVSLRAVGPAEIAVRTAGIETRLSFTVVNPGVSSEGPRRSPPVGSGDSGGSGGEADTDASTTGATE